MPFAESERMRHMNLPFGGNIRTGGSKEKKYLGTARKKVSVRNHQKKPLPLLSFISTTGAGRIFPSTCAQAKDCTRKQRSLRFSSAPPRVMHFPRKQQKPGAPTG